VGGVHSPEVSEYVPQPREEESALQEEELNTAEFDAAAVLEMNGFASANEPSRGLDVDLNAPALKRPRIGMSELQICPWEGCGLTFRKGGMPAHVKAHQRQQARQQLQSVQQVQQAWQQPLQQPLHAAPQIVGGQVASAPRPPVPPLQSPADPVIRVIPFRESNKLSSQGGQVVAFSERNDANDWICWGLQRWHRRTRC